MKFPAAALLAAPFLLSACAKDLPPPVIGPAFSINGDLKPTKMVYPTEPKLCDRYPGNSAFVRLGFTLQPDGTVANIKVLEESNPQCGYGNEAIYVFRKWKFEPHLENGVAVPFDAVYRMTFGILPPR
jgi:TonB family protein